jgi:hypothetical protein
MGDHGWRDEDAPPVAILSPSTIPAAASPPSGPRSAVTRRGSCRGTAQHAARIEQVLPPSPKPASRPCRHLSRPRARSLRPSPAAYWRRVPSRPEGLRRAPGRYSIALTDASEVSDKRCRLRRRETLPTPRICTASLWGRFRNRVQREQAREKSSSARARPDACSFAMPASASLGVSDQATARLLPEAAVLTPRPSQDAGARPAGPPHLSWSTPDAGTGGVCSGPQCNELARGFRGPGRVLAPTLTASGPGRYDDPRTERAASRTRVGEVAEVLTSIGRNPVAAAHAHIADVVSGGPPRRAAGA